MEQDSASEALSRLRGSDAARRLQEKRARERAERERIWFASPDGEEALGPMPGAEIIALYEKGELPADCLVWRDGLDDWQAVDSIDALRAVLGGPPAARPRWSEDDHSGEMAMSIDLPPPEPEDETAADDEAEDRTPPVRTEIRFGPPAGGGAGRPSKEDELSLLEDVSSRICVYMDEMAARVAGGLGELDVDQQRAFLAFELGVLEYYRQAVLPEAFGSEAELEQGFFSLLVYHAGQHYPGSAEEVITFWHSLMTGGDLVELREIGFDSMREGQSPEGGVRPGHYPGDYLRRALGIPVED